MSPTAPFFLLGECAALGAALVWAGSMTAWRFFGEGFPAREANLFKNVLSFAGLAIILLFTGFHWPARTEVWIGLAVSGWVGITLGDTAFFAALSRLNVQVTAVSQCLSPVTAATLALLWLGERLSLAETLGMVLTLTAVAGAVFLGGHAKKIPRERWWAGLGFAVLSAVSNGTGIVIARNAFQEVDAVMGTFIRVGAAVLLLIPIVRLQGATGFRYMGVLRPWRRGMGLTFSAVSGSFLGLLLMSVGIKYAKAGVAAALSLTYPIWILPLARVFLDERASAAGILCILLAVAGAALMFYH
jgi:drug/metabolite transporter (DMT)-like permease